MKKLKDLKGAKMLSKKEQLSIRGGVFSCEEAGEYVPCPEGWACLYWPKSETCYRVIEM